MTDRRSISLLGRLIARWRGADAVEGSKTRPDDHLIYAIGDIHGRHDLLVNILEKIRIDTVATLRGLKPARQTSIVFLGDYIDRGHQSREVLESLRRMERQAGYPRWLR